MPSLRLHPLLIASAACLALAACGSDDDPPTSQAKAPATTESATPTQTTTAAAPEALADDSDTPPDSDAVPEPGSTPDAGRREGPTAATPPETTTDSARPADGPTMDQRLANYARGGKEASADDAAAIRATLNGFLQAMASKDAQKTCSFTIGMPASTNGKPGISCESLTQGAPGPQSAASREMVATSRITVNGGKALVVLSQGMPMPVRKVDGEWRLDYKTLLNLQSSTK